MSRVAAAAVVVLLGGLAPACAQGAPHARGPETTVRVRNFKVDAPTTVSPGRRTFVIHGGGPSLHEFNVARTDLAPDALPLAADRTVDDTSSHPGFVHLAEAEGIDIGNTKTLSVDLSAGNYVLYCNMDGHYMAGMATRLTVLPR
jgi:uncharacterized cupredoxin-like copper-binding protein